MALMFKKIKNKSGFTITELMVSIFIIVFISTIFVGSFVYGLGKTNTTMDAQKASSNIRKIQGFTMGLKEFNGAGFPAGGWGVYFSKVEGKNNFYRLFADGDGGHIYNLDDSELFKQISFFRRVTVSNIDLDGDNSKTDVYITFLPPDPTIFICDDSACNFKEAKITISDGTNSKTIVINKFGLIDVED